MEKTRVFLEGLDRKASLFDFHMTLESDSCESLSETHLSLTLNRGNRLQGCCGAVVRYRVWRRLCEV